MNVLYDFLTLVQIIATVVIGGNLVEAYDRAGRPTLEEL